MFLAYAALFSSLMEFVLFVFAVVVVYQIFLSDWIATKRAQWSVDKSKSGSIDKIAQVKLVSDDAKGIEEFVTTNASYLSDQMVKQLVARIESLKIDHVIAEDELLKTRIAELQPEEEEQDAETIRPQRSSN
jgi:hypothetical protein